MRLTTIAVLALALVTSAAAQAPDNPPVVQVGAFRIQPDGSVGSYAVDVGEKEGDSLSSGIAAAGCRSGAGNSWQGADMPAWAIDAWQLRGEVVSLTPEQAIIQLDWERVRTAGSPTAPRPASQRITLAFGELLALDSATPSGDPSCPQPVTFGARFANRFPPGVRVSGRPAVGVGGLAGGGGRGGVSVRASARPYTAELWLVHSVPGRPDSVAPITVRVTDDAGAFDFAAVQFPVPGGTLRVQVEGNIQIVRGQGGQPTALAFQVERGVTFTPANRPSRDPAAPHDRGSRMTASRQFPGPDDVLAFEMPALQVPGGPAVPDTLSIRLRLRPAEEPIADGR